MLLGIYLKLRLFISESYDPIIFSLYPDKVVHEKVIPPISGHNHPAFSDWLEPYPGLHCENFTNWLTPRLVVHPTQGTERYSRTHT